MKVTLIDADLQEHVLACPSDGLFELGTGFGFAGVAPVEHSRQTLAGVDGSVVTGTRRLPRVLRVPLRLADTDMDRLHDKIAALAAALRPEDELRLRVERPGTSREISMRYQAGAEQLGAASFFAPTTVANVTFVADDPMWYRTSNPTSRYPVDGTFETFNNAAAAGINEATIACLSDVEVYPTIEVRGVAENVEFRHLSTTGYIRIVEKLDVATDRFVVRTGGRGQNTGAKNGVTVGRWFDANTDLSFSLTPGINRLLVSGMNNLEGATTGGFRLWWTDRFDSC